MANGIEAPDIGADYTISLSQMAGIIQEFAKAKETAMFWGGPGIGKSMAAYQAADTLECRMHDVRLGQLDTVDARGLPLVFNPIHGAIIAIAQREERPKGWAGLAHAFFDELCNNKRPVMEWAPPGFLPPQDSTANHLLFLDELPSAPPSVQAACYQLIQDRAIGEYRLPDGAAIIAAGNRAHDRAHHHQMLSPLASRFVHFDVEVPADGREWIRWATGAGIAPEVLFFIEYSPELLYAFEPKQWDGRAFPCPREWEKVSNIVQRMNLNATALRAAVRGAVGEGASIQFLAFLDIWQQLPSPDLILLDPHGAPVPTSADAMIALCGALYKSRKVDESNFEAVTTYAGRKDMREEIGEFLVGQCAEQNPRLLRTHAWKKWEIEHQ